jgi:hypothetical protein
MRNWLIMAMMAVLVGCGGVAPAKLPGHSVATAIETLGQPRADHQAVAPENWNGWFGPVPKELKEGTPYRSLTFTTGGKDYYVYAISPADYKALRGLDPPDGAEWVVIMIEDFPEGAVF